MIYLMFAPGRGSRFDKNSVLEEVPKSLRLIGGIEAVIWTEVVQGILKSTGAFICIGYFLLKTPGGASASFKLAWDNGKFSMGSLAFDFSQPTVIVLLIYGFFFYLQKYVADQTLVQRYLVAKTHREALKGIRLGASLCIPVLALFMLVGTMMWAFFKLTGEPLPSYITKADQVFPYFLSTHLPVGIAGLFIAALMAAAMSGLASDLNCLSVVCVEDFYRYLRPDSTDRKRLFVAKLIVGLSGLAAIVTGLVLAHSQRTALSMWYTVSSVVSGGLAGLFLLAFFSRRANKEGVWIGIIACVLFSGWATLTAGNDPILNLGSFSFRMHEFMIGAIGHVALFVVGYMASFAFAHRYPLRDEMTIWAWRAKRKLAAPE